MARSSLESPSTTGVMRRPVSIAITMVWLRSASNRRMTGVPRRAVAFQSMSR